MRPRFLPHDGLQGLLDLLAGRGYEVIGPRVKEGAVVLAPVKQASDLPWGVRETQSPGSYTLEDGDPQRAFGWTIGPSSLKPFLFRQQETLWQSSVDDQGRLRFESVVQARPQAVIGVRPCDVAAMLLQDRVFLGGDNVDLRYQARREALFTVAVNCTQGVETCFCVSQGGSPRVERGFDMALTEMDGGLLAEAGSAAGEEVLRELSLEPATEAQRQVAEADIAETATRQRRRTPPQEQLEQALRTSRDHPQWDVIGERCESCGNCTKLCPTCICHKQMHLPSLDGEGGEQVREWASCQSEAHSYVSGKSLRAERRERYRMRVTHKFANWREQFGTPGCVGCGRCISWCTHGIDMTENLHIIVGEPADD
ncbi:MAG: 4Fe-4S dicluster domain-containing protein [Deltaproteobacteria bacterium]|nr:4Fe-4S dicluster domain-containing protein [Deltaproteobacteria bacterium]